MSRRQLLAAMDSEEISERMARDLLRDPEYQEKVKQSRMSDDERAAQIRKMLGG